MSTREKMDFTTPWKDSDVILVVEGIHLHAHRLMLSLSSPVFDRMFNSDFKEKNAEEVPLPGKKSDEVREMLEVVYDRSKQVTESNFSFLLELSEEFQMTQLKSECIKYITTADKTGVQAIKYINIVTKFNIKHLEDICLDNIKSLTTTTLTASDEFQNSDYHTKLQVVTSRANHIESLLRKQKDSLNTLLRYLYQSANTAYMEQLREKGYEESLLSYCEYRDNHSNKKPGIKFDINCRSCRKRIKMTKEFRVRTNDVSELMDELYLLVDVR